MRNLLKSHKSDRQKRGAVGAEGRIRHSKASSLRGTQTVLAEIRMHKDIHPEVIDSTLGHEEQIRRSESREIRTL